MEMRWYYRTDYTAAANVHKIVNANPVAVTVFGASRIVRLTGSSTTDSSVGLTVSTWYRFHLYIDVDTSGNGFVHLTVYPENSTNAIFSISNALSGAGTIGTIDVGITQAGIKNITQRDAQNHDFDDIAINDNTAYGNNVHLAGTTRMGAGSTLAVHYPTSDVAGGTWVPLGGGTHFSEVDETGGSDGDTSYVNTVTGATLHLDKYNHTAYGGSDTPVSVVVQAVHKAHTPGGGGADVNHDVGLYDTGNLDVQMPGIGDTYGYKAAVIGEQTGGGALTTSWYDSTAKYLIRKDTNVGGINDKRVTLVRAEVEDDDGIKWRSLPHQSPTSRAMRGLIGR
jgi:hypothetical protein